MKNILLVTSLYPLPTKENNCTFVCHYFTKEWVKLGYNVKVIHVQPVHCWLWHKLVKYYGKQLKNWAGGGNYYARKIRKTEHYVMDGVDVYRVPIYNLLPHGRYPKKSITKLAAEIHSLLADAGFVPDVITAHSLALEIIPEINNEYQVKTCMVAHGMFPKLKKRYSNYQELINYYDIWGFRNKPQNKVVENNFGPIKRTFLCLSGIPSKYIVSCNTHSYRSPVRSFLYIGELIERKYPSALLDAVPIACPSDYSIKFIGEGPEKSRIDKTVAERNLEGKVLLTGKVGRDAITNYLDESDCFIMISRREAYGLVYLEAMARGCLVIASKNEGFDGIIIDGVNGFLCEAGNAGELAEIIKKINNMTPEERKRIADNGLATAAKMTDTLVAKDYVHELEQL